MINEFEEMENSTNQEENLTPEDEETEKFKSKDLQSALAQKEHYKKKHDKVLKELEELKSSMSADKDVQNLETPKDPLEIIKLSKVLSGYSEEETEFILRNASKKDIGGITEAIKDPMVQIAIQGMRDKVEKEKQTPLPSTKQALPDVDLLSYPMDKLGELTPEQVEKWVEVQRVKSGKSAFPK